MDSPSNNNVSNSSIPDNEEDQVVEVPLPGFRFHPTDEELVGFYLRRKVDKKPITIELIKLIDIYKYDPWDLPTSCTAGDKEWYFFCKRGRKYKNSIRPNRVTGSGFWKATGIDKPVHSHGGEYGKNNQCIGLKKTLVYYRGSAGKGTKTDWMMHEFRLPAISDNHTTTTSYIIPPNNSVKIDPQEAEIWTLCRIFKRNVSYRRYTPDWRELSSKRHPYPVDHTICSKKLCTSTTLESNNVNNTVMINREANYNYIDFSAPRPVMKNYHDQEYHDHPQGKKPHAIINRMITNNNNDNYNNGIFSQYHDRTNQLLHFSSMASSYNNIINVPYNSTDSFSSSFSPCPDDQINDDQFFTHTSWDELKAVVELALDPDIV